jgi:hypothetical protein
VKVCPAIVSVPDRAAPVVAAAAYVTAPAPEPLAPEVIDNHATALLDAVHAQPSGAVTVTLPLPPDEGTDSCVGLIA